MAPKKVCVGVYTPRTPFLGETSTGGYHLETLRDWVYSPQWPGKDGVAPLNATNTLSTVNEKDDRVAKWRSCLPTSRLRDSVMMMCLLVKVRARSVRG